MESVAPLQMLNGVGDSKFAVPVTTSAPFVTSNWSYFHHAPWVTFSAAISFVTPPRSAYIITLVPSNDATVSMAVGASVMALPPASVQLEASFQFAHEAAVLLTQ